MAAFDSGCEASYERLPVLCELLRSIKVLLYRPICVWSRIYPQALPNLECVVSSAYATVVVCRTGVVELFSSVQDALGVEYSANFQVLRSAGRGSTLFSAYYDPPLQ